jgi:hypothetical protein
MTDFADLPSLNLPEFVEVNLWNGTSYLVDEPSLDGFKFTDERRPPLKGEFFSIRNRRIVLVARKDYDTSFPIVKLRERKVEKEAGDREFISGDQEL